MSIDAQKKLDAVRRTITTLKQYERGRRYWPWQRNPVPESLDLIAEIINRPAMDDAAWEMLERNDMNCGNAGTLGSALESGAVGGWQGATLADFLGQSHEPSESYKAAFPDPFREVT